MSSTETTTSVTHRVGSAWVLRALTGFILTKNRLSGLLPQLTGAIGGSYVGWPL